MISAQDVVQVQMVGGDSLLEQLLLSAIGPAVIAAAIGWVVTRAGRKREDRRDWRDLRHERFSAALDDAHRVSVLVSKVIRERYGSMMFPGEPVQDQLAERLEEFRVNLRRLRLVGRTRVFRMMQDIYVEADAILHSVQVDDEALPDKSSIGERAGKIRSDVYKVELEMVSQLGL